MSLSEPTEYVAGQRVQCPGCQQESCIRIRTKLDGWTALGPIAVCALCDHEFGPVAGREPAAGAVPEQRRAQLAAFLATEVEPKPVLAAESAVPFCRTCQHFYQNAFHTACLLRQRDVDPNDDCPQYASNLKATGADPGDA